VFRVLVLVVLSLPTLALAGEIEVPLGERAPLKSRKAVHEVTVRDPSMLQVVVTDGAVSLEGKESGMTGITVKYEDGELERVLVVIGTAQNSKGPRMEQAKTVDLKKSADAQAKAAPKPEPMKPAKEKAAVDEAAGAVRAAAEAL